MTDYEIRQIVDPAEAEALCNLESILWNTQVTTTCDMATLIRNGLCFGANVEGQWIGAVLVSSMWDGNAFIEDVVVLPAYQRKGIASKLYDCVIEYSVKSGKAVLQTLVHPDNEESHAFHLRKGFTVTGKSNNPYGEPESPETNMYDVMKLPLSQFVHAE